MFNIAEQRKTHIRTIASTPRATMAEWEQDLFDAMLSTHIGLIVDNLDAAMDEREAAEYKYNCNAMMNTLSSMPRENVIEIMKGTCEHVWGAYGNEKRWDNANRTNPTQNGHYNILVNSKELVLNVEFKDGSWLHNQPVTHWKEMPTALEIVQ